jgi:putative MATE family efflux protein
MAARNLSVGPVPKLVAVLSLPVLATFALQSLYALVDLYFVGRLGSSALAGLGISLNTFYVVLALGQSIGTGALALLAQTYGRGDHEQVPQIFQVVFWLGTAIGLVFWGLGYACSAPFMHAFTEDPAVFREGVAFMRSYSGTFFTQVMLIALSFSFRAVGDFIVPTAIMGASVLLNVALDPLLIFGLGPVPALGIAGAGLATWFSQIVGLAGYVWMSMASTRNTLLVLRRPLFWDRRLASRVLRIGLPSALQFMMFAAVLLLTFRYLRPLGGDAAAATGVGFRLFQTFGLPGVSIGIAVSSIVGQNYGAAIYSRVRAAMVWGFVYIAAVLSFEYVLVLMSPAFWVRLFAGEPEVVRIGAQYLVITCSVLPVFGLSFIATFVAQGLGRTILPLAGTFTRLGLLVVLLAILNSAIGLSVAGVFWMGVAAMFAEAIVMAGVLAVLWRPLREPDGMRQPLDAAGVMRPAPGR